MASSWANRLTRSKVARGNTPKKVTFIYPYYDCPLFFSDQQAFWWEYSEDLRPFVSAIVVDDGSPVPVQLRYTQPFPIRLFRIAVDVPWNWLAARNIGAHHAADGWLLLTDMDHVVPEATVRSIVWGHHDPSVVYAFSRREHTGEIVAPHSASFLLTRDLFWTIGGYDEVLAGHYGSDGDFRRRIVTHAPIHVLTDELVRYEYVADASTSRYKRKQPEDAVAVQQLVAARAKDWRPTVLTFPYEEVAC